MKNNFRFWVSVFLWVKSKVGQVSGHFGSGYLALGLNCKMEFLTKFLLETRLESKSFETLADLLRFRVQKLWPKNNKIIN